MARPVGPRHERPARSARWRSERGLVRAIQPLQSFLDTEAAGGILLLLAAVTALAWANSPWRASYEALWETTLRIGLGEFRIVDDLRGWVTDGLMALFFFVVGLEIKREVTTGELRTARSLAVPAVAALGGMIVPATIYLALNAGGDGAAGWGIPMATDIAFAVGVLTLAARNAPGGMKPFLLTLAIVDDIGAILVIALVYTATIHWAALGVAGGILAAIVALRGSRVRMPVLYLALGGGLWLAIHESGVHATVAGVILGLLTPSIPLRPGVPSPLARLESLLHPWTSFVVVPLFALANAGVPLSGEALRAAGTSPITLGVLLGLVLGKPVGITGATWLATRAGIGALPTGVGWWQLANVGMVAGIGFTVSLFVADLAFPPVLRLDLAKMGILAASVLAGAAGSLALSRSTRGG